MSEQLRWDHDRMIGESYKDYAIRQRGVARAAEVDRDQARGEVEVLRAQRAAVLARHIRADQQGSLPHCRECVDEWPCPTAKALGVEA